MDRLKQQQRHLSNFANLDIDSIASEILAVLGTTKQLQLLSRRYPKLDISTAYHVTAAVRDLRIARGERPVGRKIGFTNRTIWDEYNVHAPIWSYTYDTTVRDLSTSTAADTAFSLDGISEPRIEPEIVFGLAKSPTPSMDDDTLLGCIGWIAHGFEIVHSAFAGWKFTPADTVAAVGLHSALLIGTRHEHTSQGSEKWKSSLRVFEIGLYCNGQLMDQGRGLNVLGSPLAALRHLVELLAVDQFNPPLAAGEIITTGTLTKALPVNSGETWHTELRGISLSEARIRFV